ncbi:MAG: tetratricopeptide repeat protein [Pseudomonadota bacterium]
MVISLLCENEEVQWVSSGSESTELSKNCHISSVMLSPSPSEKRDVKAIFMKQVKLLIGVVFITFSLSLGFAADSEANETQANSDDGGIAYMRGKELLLRGEFEKALPFLEQARSADPKSPLVNSQLAETYLRINQPEKAEQFGKQAVELEPSNTDYRNTLAGIYASLKKYDEAKEQYKKISELDPTNAKAPLLIGILDAEGGKVLEGIETLSRVIEQNPENVMALFYRARMYIEQDNVEKAKADLDKALALKPSFVEAGSALGLIYEKLNDNEQAIKVYSRIQGEGSYKKRLAQLYLQNGQTDKALQELLEYEKGEPDDYTARVKIGLIYFEKKNLSSARKVFEGILKEESGAENVRFYLAWVLEEMKQFNDSLKEFRKVTKDSTLYKESALHIGFILKEQKKYDEGLKFSKKLMESDPEEESYYDMHAAFFEAKKEYSKSLAVIDKGLKAFPKSEKLLYFKGVLLEKTGDKPGAISSMKQIINLNPENYHALNFVAYLFADLGENLDEAETYVRKAMSLKPNDGFIEDSLGWILFKKGKLKDAQEVLERAAALQPDEAIILEHLGDVYEKQKEYAKAKEFYKKAAELAQNKDKEMVKKVQKKIGTLVEERVPTAQKNSP